MAPCCARRCEAQANPGEFFCKKHLKGLGFELRKKLLETPRRADFQNVFDAAKGLCAIGDKISYTPEEELAMWVIL